MSTSISDELIPSGQAAKPPVINIRRLRKTRRASDRLFELEVPRFVVGPGEFVVLAGWNGCGKSTLLDMIGLILSPDSAEQFDLNLGKGGESYEAAKLSEGVRAAIRRQYFGYVLQSGGLLQFLSVRGNARLPLRLNGIQPGVEMPGPLTNLLGVSEYLRRKPASLSGGQRQRAAILRALIHKPMIVLADEPTAAVDELTAGTIIDQFHQAARIGGAAVVVVTHDIELVRNRADRIYSFKIEELPAPRGIEKSVRSTLVLSGGTHVQSSGENGE